MKTKGSFARTICIWIVTVLLVTIFTGGTSALICRKQIGEAIAYRQSEELLEKSNDKSTASLPQEKEFHKEEEHDFEDKLAIFNKFSPLNTSQKAALIILAAFWLAVILLYWFSVTSMLAERAELIKFNRHI